jgi:predicted dehydrogenase
MKKTGVAIIGCGAISSTHAEAVVETDSAKLLMVADIDTKKAETLANKYGCDYTTNYKELLRNPDVQSVHLCTPHYLHAPMAKAFMEAGKHVLVEKPMGINFQECEELNEISRQTRCYLGVCLQNRYHATTAKMKELVDCGKMGRILGARAFVTWMRDKAYYEQSQWRGTWGREGGSLLINQAIHTLDLLQWLMGEIKDVRGSVATHFLSETIETEDTAEALLLFESGARALFFASNAYVSNAPVYLELECEEGTMILNGALTINWKDGRKTLLEDTTRNGYKAYWGIGHKYLIQDFYHCLNSGKPFPVNGVEGSKAIRIIQKIYACHGE